MIFRKKLSRKQVLEALAVMAVDYLPKEAQGTIDVTYDEQDGVEIVFRERPKKFDVS